MADATKNCESFSFRSLSQVQKLLSSGPLAYKIHLHRNGFPEKENRSGVVNLLEFTRCVRSRCFCGPLHFLTIINN